MDAKQEALVRWILEPISDEAIARREAAMRSAAGLDRKRSWLERVFGGMVG